MDGGDEGGKGEGGGAGRRREEGNSVPGEEGCECAHCVKFDYFARTCSEFIISSTKQKARYNANYPTSRGLYWEGQSGSPLAHTPIPPQHTSRVTNLGYASGMILCGWDERQH